MRATLTVLLVLASGWIAATSADTAPLPAKPAATSTAGAAQVKECDACKDTKLIWCEACRNKATGLCTGLARTNCATCGSKGWTACPDCRGKWGHKCPTCKGQGKAITGYTQSEPVVCPNCRGGGMCTTCGYTGKVPGPRIPIVGTCPTCKGIGDVYTCKGQCALAHSKGRIPCPDCTLTTPCATCGGKRKVTCPHCPAGADEPAANAEAPDPDKALVTPQKLAAALQSSADPALSPEWATLTESEKKEAQERYRKGPAVYCSKRIKWTLRVVEIPSKPWLTKDAADKVIEYYRVQAAPAEAAAITVVCLVAANDSGELAKLSKGSLVDVSGVLGRIWVPSEPGKYTFQVEKAKLKAVPPPAP